MKWHQMKVEEPIPELQMLAKMQKWANEGKELPPEIKLTWDGIVMADSRELAAPEQYMATSLIQERMEEAMEALPRMKKNKSQFQCQFREKLWKLVGETPQEMSEREPIDQLILSFQVIMDMYLDA